MLTEFGGIKLAEEGEGWGYTAAISPEDLEARYVWLLKNVREIPDLSGFCYTQLTDTYQEANGLLTMDRKPKFSIESIRLANRGPGNEEERQREKELCQPRIHE